MLFGAGEECVGGSTVNGRQKRKRGFMQKQIDRVIAKGGRLSLHEVLRCRVRYFTDGVAIGGKAFLLEHLSERDSRARSPESTN